MSTVGPDLRAVPGSELADALARALDGGPAVLPLPSRPTERAQTLAMARTDTPLETGAAALVATSGSTGRPKGVLLSATAIRAAVAATHQRLGGPGSWVSMLPEHYVAGLMVVARTVVAGTRLRRVDPDLTDLDQALAGLGDGPRYCSLVPTQLVRACADPSTQRSLAAFDAVLLGGAAAPPDVVERAREQGINVVTTYGMSETCGGCVYDGVPLPGVDIELGADDRVFIAGPMLFSGYRGRPDLSATALIDGRLRTSDRGRWIKGRLEILGRTDAVVITGGHNVDLDELERAAAALGEVAMVGVPDAEWGTTVVAVTTSTLTLTHLIRGLGDRPAYALPRRLVRLDSLPRTSGGKIDRVKLRQLLGPA